MGQLSDRRRDPAHRRSPPASTTGAHDDTFAGVRAAARRSDRSSPPAAQRARVALGGQRAGQGAGLAVRDAVPHRRRLLPPDRRPDRDDLGAARPDQPRQSGMVQWVRGSHRDPVDYRPNLFVTDEPIPGTERRRGARRARHARAGRPARQLRAGARRHDGAPRPDPARRPGEHVGDPSPGRLGALLRRRRPLPAPRRACPTAPAWTRWHDGDPVGPPWCPLAWPR